MLIIPVSGKIGWKNPPIVTLGLIVVNCLIYFLFQLNDDQAGLEAEQFYFKSGLAQIEIPLYINHLEAQAGTSAKEPASDETEMEDDELMLIHFAIEMDAAFLKGLMADQILTPQDPQHGQWKELRGAYEERRHESVAFSFGLRPAFARAAAFFTYMFLHGGVEHLVGNMIFLWILGCMLEIGSGRVLFSIIYTTSGILAALFFYAVYPSNTVPLVGASGAIAGLMGAYTVLYGKKSVSVFYSLGFYFNTIKVRAIALLPIWLANECYQLFFTGASHVAYAAHIGGIVSGAALAFAGERIIGTVDRNSFEALPQDKITPLMHQALEHLGKLEMDQAQSLFEQIIELSPENHEALMHLFNIHKLNPNADTFHDIAQRILRVLLRKPEHHQEALACYETYAGLTRRKALPFGLYLQIAGAMALTGKVDEAAKIVLAIFNKDPETAGLPSSLLKLAQAFQINGRPDHAEKCRSLIRRHYPNSVEAAIIQKSNGGSKQITPSAPDSVPQKG